MSEQAKPVESYLDDGDLTAAAWGRALREHVILGQECGDCGHVTAAPKAACARCGNRDVEVVELPDEGEVYSETTITVPPEGYEGPYKVAIVSLGDGEARVLGQVDDDAEIGDEVSLVDIVDEDDRDIPSPVFA